MHFSGQNRDFPPNDLFRNVANAAQRAELRVELSAHRECVLVVQSRMAIDEKCSIPISAPPRYGSSTNATTDGSVQTKSAPTETMRSNWRVAADDFRFY